MPESRGAPSLDALRHLVRSNSHLPEPEAVKILLDATGLSHERRERVVERAVALVEGCRARSHQAGTLDAFLQEFGLSNREGIALMCLAEALLRVPDEATANRLIAEKIQSGDWGAHRGKSSSRFVNASVWGLMLTGRVVRLDDSITEHTDSWMQRLVSTLGEPVVRQAVLQAMRIMGGQYVLGRSIEEGFRKGVAANAAGTSFSFDMLGEGARTASDAQRHFEDYIAAIATITDAGKSDSVVSAHGISVKLSALHPRYEFSQKKRVMAELLPRVRHLAVLAKQGGLGFSIDAEEAHRLDISLDLFEALARDEELAGWYGLGFVLQTYLKQAPAVTDWLLALARDSGRRLMVRVVKGAYWDGEIKAAQEHGLADYPVFTRKCHSDLCYQVCAEKLLGDPDHIFCQFATHNAHTVAVVQELAAPGQEFEFQRLHGMGELLFDEVQKDAAPPQAIRVYAPIGTHRDLLPYLVRRLLENGANSSFVNRFLDAQVPPAELMVDPVEETRAEVNHRHAKIPRPRDLYREEPAPWLNSRGLDLHDPITVADVLETATVSGSRSWSAAPMVAGHTPQGAAQPVCNPADPSHVVGRVVQSDEAAIEAALRNAVQARAEWNGRGAEERARCLERAAEYLEENCAALMGLIVAEAGRTIVDALSEVREAVDFCRYYAQQARAHCGSARRLPGPAGEVNELSLHGRGTFVCISPWNFPLAIFLGQVSAALAAGNTVIAKPAEQTPLIGAQAVALMHRAGVPEDVLQLLPGEGARVGGALLGDPRTTGVAFTGSTETAKLINRQLAEREGPIVPLIAETGGLNVMLVDATALPEQVVDDVITSAFQSAGQRCSALRVLYLQEDIADDVLQMLKGAMAELSIGNPAGLATDVGPVIDEEARDMLRAYERKMCGEDRLFARCELGPGSEQGYFVAPQVYEIQRLSQLPGEVFGPILHVIRYAVADIDQVLADINASGYGLTLGIHSRIDGFAREVFEQTRVGNTYINRNMVGAVVGVNPFGGQGLSGTGPKAGGPHYLLRFATEKTRTDNVAARGGNAELINLEEE